MKLEIKFLNKVVLTELLQRKRLKKGMVEKLYKNLRAMAIYNCLSMSVLFLQIFLIN